MGTFWLLFYANSNLKDALGCTQTKRDETDWSYEFSTKDLFCELLMENLGKGEKRNDTMSNLLKNYTNSSKNSIT